MVSFGKNGSNRKKHQLTKIGDAKNRKLFCFEVTITGINYEDYFFGGCFWKVETTLLYNQNILGIPPMHESLLQNLLNRNPFRNYTRSWVEDGTILLYSGKLT